VLVSEPRPGTLDLDLITSLPRLMKHQTTSNLDLRTLTILNEVYRTRSVSQAAKNMDMPQSTVSMHLARLRRQFKDPLFVRAGAGIEPTPHMNDLSQMLEKAESLIEAAFSHYTSFDAATSDRKFSIGVPEMIRANALPTLIRRLQSRAPGVRLEVRDLNDDTPQRLQAGDLDIAVGIAPPMGPGIRHQRLYKERFVCAVQAGHPRIHADISLRQFEEEFYLDISTGGIGTEILSKALETGEIQRTVRFRVPGAFGLSSVLKASDCLAIVPEQLGRMLASTGHIKLLKPPLELPQFYVAQYWHRRYDRDPANTWLRQMIAELFSERTNANARNQDESVKKTSTRSPG
jgi:DNA-binding transcriptional LysR family regulator